MHRLSLPSICYVRLEQSRRQFLSRLVYIIIILRFLISGLSFEAVLIVKFANVDRCAGLSFCPLGLLMLTLLTILIFLTSWLLVVQSQSNAVNTPLTVNLSISPTKRYDAHMFAVSMSMTL